jgi:bacterioferritin-associated ferredoxin
MRYASSTFLGLAAVFGTASACGGCDNPLEAVVHERNVRRMQPEASNAVSGPKAELEWGQLNFMHTVRKDISG